MEGKDFWWWWCWCWGGGSTDQPSPPRCYTNWSYSLNFYILTTASTCSCSGVQKRIIYKIVKNIIPKNLFLSKILVHVRIFFLYFPLFLDSFAKNKTRLVRLQHYHILSPHLSPHLIYCTRLPRATESPQTPFLLKWTSWGDALSLLQPI